MNRSILFRLTVVTILFSALIFTTTAADQTFTVNSTADEPDANIGDEICATASDECTLRAAIAEANANDGSHTINFDIGGGGEQTIVLTYEDPDSNVVQPLPDITANMTIDGTTQPGFTDEPLVTINAENLIPAGTFSGSPPARVFRVTEGTSVIRGLILVGSGNYQIYLTGGSEHVIAGNWIGTDFVNEFESYAGIYVEASGVRIGGTTPEDRNVISGLEIGPTRIESGDGNIIQGNYMGTDPTGTQAVLNNGSNFIGGVNTLVGGPTEAERNIIVSDEFGISVGGVEGDSGTIQNNYFNLDATGTQILATGGSRSSGISTNGFGEFLIEDNVFVGFTYNGFLEGSGTYTYHGNYFGTDPTGTLASGGNGLWVTDNGTHFIGGPGEGEGNVISGNSDDGVYISMGSRSGGRAIFQGNYIGLAPNGIDPLPNGGSGITLSGFNIGAIQIGGTEPGEGNYISGNNISGINNTTNVTAIEGNVIGLNINGQVVGNESDGIYTILGEGLVIGGTELGQANVIAGNGRSGIRVLGEDVSARGNSIFANAGLGFDLIETSSDSGGPTPNDPGDDDSVGANNLQNFPIITSATVNGSNITIEGELDSNPLRSFTLDFYANEFCDVSGYGEGEIYLGALENVETDGGGLTSFSVTLPYSGGRYIVGTAIAASNDMSEFSPCFDLGEGAATPEPTPTAEPTMTVEPTDDPTATADPTTTPDPTTGIERIAPADGFAMTSTDDYISRFQWRDNGAEWYRVWVGPDDYSTFFFDDWFAASEVCDASGICTMNRDVWIVGSGQFEWWMTYWSDGDGSAFMDRWEGSSFSIEFDAPGNLEGLTGTANVTGSGVTVQWDAAPDALWYNVWVGPDTYDGNLFFEWQNAAEICTSGTCTIEIAGTPPAGEYQLWLQAWNPVGIEDWMQITSFSVTP